MPLFDPIIFDIAIFDVIGDGGVNTNSIITQGYGVFQHVITQGYGLPTPSSGPDDEVIVGDDEVVFLGLLGQILANMERYNGITTTSDHVCEPGMDTITSPMKNLLRRLKQ